MIDPEAIQRRAAAELHQEEFREAVEAAKADLRERRERRRWWLSLIPFTISINRRER